MSTTSTNRDILIQIHEDAAAGHLDKVTARMSPDLVIYEPDYLPYGGVYKGPEGFEEVMAKAAPLFDISGLTLECIVADGDHVVTRNSEAFADPESGRTDILELWTLKDGLVTEIRVYWHILPKSIDTNVPD